MEATMYDKFRGCRTRGAGTRRLLTALALVGGVAATSTASAQQLRFATTAPGGIVATGNTLGLSSDGDANGGLNGPGTNDSIGTFITLSNTVDSDPANPLNPWPMGTTSNWMQNGSEAVLALPSDSQVLYAELLWGGSHGYEPISLADRNGPVTFSSDGASISVNPSTDTALEINEAASGFQAMYYARSADVTAFVQQHGTGIYAVEGVPGTQNEAIQSLNAAGWTLVVAYRDTSQPVRNLTVFVGGSFVDENATQDYSVSGFCAPPAGLIEGEVVVSAIEGDADLAGDQLLIAPTAGDTFVNLFGDNNPQANFFCSQINDDDGQLDTSGSFGMLNHDPFAPSATANVAGGRQGWDITSVPVSSSESQLFANQTSAVIRTVTTGDSYAPTLVAFEIDVNAPNFSDGNSFTQASTNVVSIGDTLVVTAQLENAGQAPANNVSLRLPVEGGLNLVDFTTDGSSGDIEGMTVTASMLNSGVNAGDLTGGETRVVVATFEVVGPAQGTAFQIQPLWDYDFIECVGDGPLAETFSGETATVSFAADPVGGAGGGGGGGIGPIGGMGGAGNAGNTGNDGTGNSSSGDPSDDPGEDGGCGCEVPGRSPAAPAGASLLALLGLVALRRRRRS